MSISAPFPLPNFKVLDSCDPHEVQVRYSSIAQPNRIYRISDEASFKLAEIKWNRGRLTYAEIQGSAIHASVALGSEVVLGVVLKGTAEVVQNLQSRQVKGGDVLLYLPADECVHLLQSTTSFSLRIPMSHQRLIRMRSRPFRATESIERRVEPGAAADLRSLCLYMAREAESSHGRKDAHVQLDAVGLALTERALSVIESVIPGRNSLDPHMIKICRACDRAIASSERHYSADELAVLASCSHRQLYRAFSTIADTTPMEYQRRSHLTRARSYALLHSDTGVTMSRLAETFGFGSATAFRRAYADEFGQSPLESIEHRRQVVAGMLQRSRVD